VFVEDFTIDVLLFCRLCRLNEIYSGTTDDYRVVLGKHSLSDVSTAERYVRVKQFSVHENYSSVTHENDIALITLAEDVTFNEYIRPICLPHDVASVDLFCVATGWGRQRGTDARFIFYFKTLIQHLLDCKTLGRKWPRI
jgi:Trypsin